MAHPPPQIPDHELLRLIGHGGYGQVWLARNVMGTLRAVKVLYRHDFGDEHPFDREFKGIQKFEPISRSHPGVVNILQIGRNEAEGYFYYVMELADDAGQERSAGVEGRERGAGVMEYRSDGKPVCPEFNAQHSMTPILHGSIADSPQHSTTPTLHDSSSYLPRTLRSDLKLRGRLSFDECLQIGLSLTSALEHLHQHGLVHRDVKPSNIIFVNGQPKLADIGLVAGVDEARSFVGTEGFVPPEGPGKPQADLYSLGIVLYMMSTGKRPDAFPEPLADLAEDPDHQRWLELNAVIHKACHAEPRERYQTAGEMHKDLLRLQAGQSVRRQQRLTRALKLGRQAAPIVALAVALVAAAAAFWPGAVSPRNALPVGHQPVFVLPQRSPPGDTVSEELAGRVTDALIESLGVILGPDQVGPRKSGWLLKSEEEVRRKAFEEQNARETLGGKVTVVSNRLEVTLSSYTNPPGPPVWTESFAGTTNEILAFEWAVLNRLAQSFSLRISDELRPRVSNLLSNNLAALGWCRRGDQYMRAHSVERLTRAKEAFLEAKQVDPNCIRALHGALFVNRLMALHRSHRDSAPEVISLSHDVLRLDDTDYYARYWLAAAKSYYEWNWDEGVAEFRAVLSEVPEGEQYFCDMAVLERCLGRFKEARIYQARQDAQLTQSGAPLWVSALSKYVDARYEELYEGNRETTHLYDKVITGGRLCQQQDPEVAYGWWIEALGHVGKREYLDAIRTIQKGRSLYESQELAGLEAYANARMGERDKALGIVRELMAQPFTQPYWVARIYAALGDKDKALLWLDKAVEDRCEWLTKPDFGCGGLWLDEAWDDFRTEPRFLNIKAATGLKWPGER